MSSQGNNNLLSWDSTAPPAKPAPVRTARAPPSGREDIPPSGHGEYRTAKAQMEANKNANRSAGGMAGIMNH